MLELEREIAALRSIALGEVQPSPATLSLGRDFILRMVASGSPVPEILKHICLITEEQLPGARCCIVRADASGKILGQGISTSLPQAYLDAIVGLPTDALSAPSKELIRKFGLRACWSQPILSAEGNSLGCFALYCDDPKAPSDDASVQRDTLLYLASLALAREERERTLRESSEFTRSILESSIDAIKLLNLEGKIEFINAPGLLSMEANPGQDLRGTEWSSFFQEPDRSAMRKVIEAARGGKESRLQAFRATLRGNPKWWDILVVPIRGVDQAPTKILITSRDITEQKLAEDALRSSERHLRNVLDSLFAFVGVCTPDGVLTFANKAPVEAAGLRTEEVIGKPVWETYWWCYTETVRQQLRNAFDLALQGESSRYDVDVRMKDGALMPIDFMLVPLRNASGEITHVIPSAVEISSRKRAETELKNSKERLELAQAATNVGIFDWDVINDTSVCSPEWMHVYGFPEDETPTHAKWLDAVHPEDRAVARRRALEAVAIGEKYNDEFRVVWPDGSVHWVSSFGKTLFKDGKPWRFIGTALDVTAHKEADVALRQSEERFRTVVEAVPGLVFLTDKEGRNIFTNKSFERYTGLSESELLGDKWKSIVHHADLERNIEHWNLCVLQRKPYEIEHRLRRWDGVFRWMLTRGVPLHDEAGEIQRWLGICTDIEDHKRVEQVLRQTVENLEQYAYVASHDLQEPLRTISAFTQILERKYKSQLDEAADKYIHFIVNAANRMQHLIEDLLTYSRATSDKERLVESVDLNAVFDEVINTLDSRIAETRALISCDRLPVVLGDKGGLGQVIQNLLANAIKYCQPDIPPVISIRVERRSTDWCFTVSDNGIGFSPEHSERIFGIFKRLHGTDVPGTGIGLAIVKTIIERHGGHIWATSEGVNEGAAFSFTLP